MIRRLRQWRAQRKGTTDLLGGPLTADQAVENLRRAIEQDAPWEQLSYIKWMKRREQAERGEDYDKYSLPGGHAMSEKRYTLAEAKLELNKVECDRRGHRWEIDYDRWSGDPTRLSCGRCGRAWPVDEDKPSP